MNSLRWSVLAAVIIMALAGALLWVEQRGSTVNAVVVALDGPANTMVAITTEVDGESTTSQEPLPTTITRTVKTRFTVAINLIDGQGGPIQAEMTVGGTSKGSATGNRSVIGRLELDGDKIRLASLSGL